MTQIIFTHPGKPLETAGGSEGRYPLWMEGDSLEDQLCTVEFFRARGRTFQRPIEEGAHVLPFVQ